MAYRKDDIPKVTIEGMKIGGKELAEKVENNILNGSFDLGIEKIAKYIVKRQDNAMAMEFTKCIGELLKKNGVVPKIKQYGCDFYGENSFQSKFGVIIDELDFSEHDKVFEDKIASLEKELLSVNVEFERQKFIKEMADYENQELKQRIAELESKETEKPTKINLNDRVKVKLTPLGAEIYYHKYDEVNKQIKENGGTELEPMMPQIDKDGYTEFQLHHFISLYGEHIGMCKPNVIEPLDIVIAE